LVDRGSVVEHQRDTWRNATAQTDLNRMLAFDWRYTLAESDLPKVRGTAHLAGIEVAFPFLDDALLEFSMRLPSEFKVRGMKLRWFFKEALRGFLPDEIIAKKKQGFGLPFGVWAGQHTALNALMRDAVQGFAVRGIMRPEFLNRLVDVHLPAHPGYYGEMVWIVVVLEQWLRAHAPDFRLHP
jgi:asparagine synthase (glutamine-hydrolysing)